MRDIAAVADRAGKRLRGQDSVPERGGMFVIGGLILWGALPAGSARGGAARRPTSRNMPSSTG
jgi:hypothetical protein